MSFQDLGAESVLGEGIGEDAETLRGRLALATRYLANWYRATKGSENQAVWYQRIDALRAKVERAYAELCKPANVTFGGRGAMALYASAAADWPQLWRDLTLSADTLPEPSLLDKAASFIDAPFKILPALADDLGAAVGGAAGNLLRQIWVNTYPFLIGGVIIGGVWYFRAPLLALMPKGK